jgi:hypothetical protein
VLGVFLAADAPQFLQELAYSLGAEVVAAFGWPEAFVVEGGGDDCSGAAGLGEFAGAGCQLRKVAELVQAADRPDDLAAGAVPACPDDLDRDALAVADDGHLDPLDQVP